jgi:signal transduction histidine kinase/ligand-binding sensor domain-containing protein
MPRRFAHQRLTFNPTVFGGLLLLVCAASPVCAQYRFDHWTTEQGLPQNQVNAITQTRDGYLWLATSDGLARFDGVRFTVFKRSNTPGFENNRLASLYEDRQGRLWIGSEEGALICYEAGRFTSYSERDGLPTDRLVLIEEDEAGRLWLTGQRRNLVELRDGRFIVHRPADYLPGVLAPRHLEDRCWWSQDDRGVHIFTRGRRLSLTKQDGLPSLQINSVRTDQHGTLWIGTQAGLVRVKDGRLSVIPLQKFLPGEDIGGLCYEDRQSNIWYPKSFYLRQGRADSFVSFAEQVRDTILQFYEDREGSIWIGASEGLYRARPLPVRTLTEAPGVPFHLTDLIYSVLEDRNGNVWLGKWGGGLSRYCDGQFTHYVGGAAWRASWSGRKAYPDAWANNIVYTEGLFGSRVTALYEDRTGVIWVGTESNEESGVSRLADGKFTRYSAQHGLAQTWAMLQDRAGDFWFATTTGLTRQHNGSFTIYTTQDGLPANECHALLEDREGRLWIGTHGGLALLEQGRFRAWTERDGLAGKQVRSLYEDEQGALWIGTYDGGLTRFKDGRLTPYTSKQGLFNDGISHILDDGRGNFWLSCNRGIFRVSQQQLNDYAAGQRAPLTSVVYDAQDGMLKAECNGGRQPGGWKLRNGQLWFPTMEGVAIIDPATLRLNSLPPPIVIEDCRLNQKRADCGAELRIEPGQDHLEIQYTANSFIKPEQVKFRYRLAGLETEWVEAGNRRVAYYPHLPPGDYLFIVRAANSDGVWNERGQSLRIIVSPSFWQTWWFTGLCLLLVTGSAVLIYRQRHQRRIRQLQREKSAQQNFTHQLLESQEQERQRIANNLHDSLSQDLLLIRNWALQGADLLAAQTPGRQQLDEIAERSAHAIAEAKEIIYNLRPLQLEQVGLAGAIRIMFRKLSSSSGVAFTADLIECEDALSPEAKINLYRIVQEGANNVIKHADATQARLTLKLAERQLALVLQDNGRGFEVAAVTANGARGLGLASLAQRAQMLGGQLAIESQPGAGTTVTLIINLPETLRGN